MKAKKKNTFTAVDLFCGAGGTTTGLLQAAEDHHKEVSMTAINHWNVAIETHSKNYPHVRPLCENLDNINPRKMFPKGRIDLLVGSPECTHHSKAKSGTPKSEQSRSTAWRIIDWASALYIDNILIENVAEFTEWGPLGTNGKPLKSMKGRTFQAFKFALESLGYRVDYRVLNCADYGDATHRERFFMIARRNNKKFNWPSPSHIPEGGKHLFGATESWVPGRSVIDWNVPAPSIYGRGKPLVDKTLRRIEHGIRQMGSVELFDTSSKTMGGSRPKPFLVIMKGKSKSRSLEKPFPTLTTRKNMYLCQPVIDPAAFRPPVSNTSDLREDYGLINAFQKAPGADILYRIVKPHELAGVHSFPRGYHFEGTETEVVKQIGNSVPVKTARALCGNLM